MAKNLHKKAKPNLFGHARNNRQVSTEAEEMLWQALRNRKLAGFKFRRQHPVDEYVLDFYCHEASLGIELDGGYHELPDQKAYDEGRAFEIKSLGIKVIRFKNEEVITDLEGVLGEIRKYLHLTSP